MDYRFYFAQKILTFEASHNPLQLFGIHVRADQPS